MGENNGHANLNSPSKETLTNLQGADEISISEDLSQITRKTRSLAVWYKVMLGCFIILPFSFVVGPLAWILGLGFIAVLLVTFVLGIVSFRKSNKNEAAFANHGYLIPSIIMPIIIVLSTMISLLTINDALGRAFFSSWELNEIGAVLFDYLETNDGQLSKVDKWCDLLLDKSAKEDEHDVFGNYSDRKFEFPYALNKHAIGLGKKIPDDMVVLFTSRPGWNQVGGPELTKDVRYIEVLFGDQHTEQIRKRHIQYLKWKPGDSGIISSANVTMPFILLSTVLIVMLVFIIVKAQNRMSRYWIFALILGFSSAGFGAFFGGAAEGFFYALGDMKGISWWAGPFTGSIMAICYVLVLGRVFTKKKPGESIVGYATFSGAVTGIVSSVFIHAFLMIGYEESYPVYLIAGSSFGVWAGVILGWVSSGIIRFYNKASVAQKTIQ